MRTEDVSLNIAVVGRPKRSKSQKAEVIEAVIGERDSLEFVSGDELAAGAGRFDMAIAMDVVGPNPLSGELAEARIPSMAMSSYHAFHPYHAAFYRDLERAGGVALPAWDPEQIAASLHAVRAGKRLRSAVLLVVDIHDEGFRAERVQTFAAGAKEHLGVEIHRRPVAELVERAAAFDDERADRELDRWYAEVLEGPGEMDPAHMRQAARLYLAEREMIDETGAVGITVDDIHGFLTIPEPMVMPNVSYGPLVFDGLLAAEEGDIGVLVAELLLLAALGAHPTMSNIYLAFRDQLTAAGSGKAYTHELELADFRQCVADNHVTAAHFSTSGVLPPNMMEEKRYRVREARPSWPGQSMIAATPKLGPVVMARMTPDAAGVHLVPGEADGLGFGDQYGWYRGRWFIRIPSVCDFIERCQHQHYAIGPENGNLRALKILTGNLLGLDAV